VRHAGGGAGGGGDAPHEGAGGGVGSLACAAGFAHRLDRDTSGCLVRAKTKQALLAIDAQFKKGQVCGCPSL